MKSTILSCSVLIGAILSAASVSAATWYADATRASSGDGKSPETAFKTIKEAVEAADTDDTVYVLPGVYDEGEMTGQRGTGFAQRTRVTLSKRITLKSTGGKEVTHIVGAYDAKTWKSDTDGSKTVQCVWIGDTAKGSIVEGFTLRDGGCNSSGVGGGAIASGTTGGKTADNYTIAYSTVSNCVSKFGAMRFGLAVSTLFDSNGGSTYGTAYQTSMFNCIVIRNRADAGGSAVYNHGPLINCTVVTDRKGRGIEVSSSSYVDDDGNGHSYNTVCIGNAGRGYSLLCGHSSVFDEALSASSENCTRITYGSLGYTNILMSTATCDIRPLAGGCLDGKGNRAYIDMSIIPAQYRSRDFYGNAIGADDKIPIGVIVPSVPRVTAGVVFDNPVLIDGKGPAATSYQCHYEETWPKQIWVSPVESETNTFMALAMQNTTYNDSTTDFFCGHDHGMWVTMPALMSTGCVAAVANRYSRYVAVSNLYVDASVATTGNGSKAHPFRTIQEAVVNPPNQKFTWIHVAPGTYDENYGTDANYGFKARVCVPNYKYVYIDAEGSAEDTFLVGASGGNGTTELPGCGADAIHGVSMKNGSHAAIRGFTITNCYSTVGTSAPNGFGAAFYATCSTINQAVDCIFTCNTAYRGSCMYQGFAVRCLFRNNWATYGAIDYTKATACVFANNACSPKTTYASVCESCKVYSSVFDDANANSTMYAFASYSEFANCIFRASGRLITPKNANYRHANNIVAAARKIEYDFRDDQYHRAEPLVAKPIIGDVRLAPDSPAIGRGSLSNDIWQAQQLATFTTTDYYGNPLIGADGTLPIGAGAEIRTPETIYVDAANGDDTADGLTAATARKTLAAAAELARSGDTILALPGSYDEGFALCDARAFTAQTTTTPACNLKNRVIVPQGVTLASRDGAETTFIVGAGDPSPVDKYNRGGAATRCVFLEYGATVKGFTLTGGRTGTTYEDKRFYEDGVGAGVFGRSVLETFKGTPYPAAAPCATYTTVENCILSNCVADCGGAACQTSLRGCRVLACTATHFGSATYAANLYSTVVDACRGEFTADIFEDVVNCVFGTNNLNEAGTDLTLTLVGANGYSAPRIYNSIFCGDDYAGEYSKEYSSCSNAVARNCYFSSGMANMLAYVTNAVDCVTDSGAANRLLLADDFSIELRTSPLVDAGLNPAGVGAVDLAGVQRIQNGTIDIGAFEFNWLPIYSDELGQKAAQVTECTSSVTEQTGLDGKKHAVMGDGDTMTVAWAGGLVPGGRYFVNVTLDGTGELRLYLNGVLVQTFTESGTYAFSNRLTSNGLVFEYASTSGGTAYVASLQNVTGSKLIIR